MTNFTGAGGGPGASPPGQPPQGIPSKPAQPRRVTGGVRVQIRDWPAGLGWAGRKWLALGERESEPADMAEGLAWARKGQTRALELLPGRIVAVVQGIHPRPTELVFDVPRLADAEWARVLDTLADRAGHAADILRGEVSEPIEEAFASRGVSLIPHALASDRITSTRGPGGWTIPACCAWIIASQAIDRDPGKLFALRGLPMPELLSELRHRRSHGNTPDDRPAIPEAVASVPGVDAARELLGAATDRFWHAGPGLGRLDTPIRRPPVSHPLLRRLGPSPFKDGKFPLAGLLATCYDMLSEDALRFEAGTVEEPGSRSPGAGPG